GRTRRERYHADESWLHSPEKGPSRASVRADAGAADRRAHTQPRPVHLSLHGGRIAAVDDAIEVEVMTSAIGRAQAGASNLKLLNVRIPTVYWAAIQKALVDVHRTRVSHRHAVREDLNATRSRPRR